MKLRRFALLGLFASFTASLAVACGSAPASEGVESDEAALTCGHGFTKKCEILPGTKIKDCECVPSLVCGAGTVQVGAQCVSCGKRDQPMCADNTCEPGTEGPSGYCRACGTSGLPACIWLAKCQPNLQVVDGTCTPCGVDGAVTCNAGAACVPGLEPSRLGNVCGAPWGAQGQRCGEGGGCKPRLVCGASGTCEPEPRREPRQDEGCGGFEESCCTDPVYTLACIGDKVCRPGGWFHEGSNVCLDPLPGGYNPNGPGVPVCPAAKSECGSCAGAGEYVTSRHYDDTEMCSRVGSNYVVVCATPCATEKVITACDHCPSGYKQVSSIFDAVTCESGTTLKLTCQKG